MDLVTPALALGPGRVTAASNYEPTQAGYARMLGYERFDGRPSPRLARYWVLAFSSGAGQCGAGDMIRGVASDARATVTVVSETGGTWETGTAAGYLGLSEPIGQFEPGEGLEVWQEPEMLNETGGLVAETDAIERAPVPGDAEAVIRRTAFEAARALIQPVPGSGPVRGVWVCRGTVYAFRDKVGGMSAGMYRATSDGWQPVDLAGAISFTAGGVYEPVEGDVLVGASSGATAIILRVVVRTGAWSNDDAAGAFMAELTTPANFTPGEALDIGANSDVARAASPHEDHHLLPGGRYEFVNHNFYGAADLYRMYGLSGTGYAFEFDGTIFTQLIGPVAGRWPRHIAVHRNHLFLSYPGGSVQHSATGLPHSFEVLAGAGEFGLGEEVTGFLQDWAKVLVIFGRNKVAVLSGDDSENFTLDIQANDAGAIEWTPQLIGTPVYMDDAGLRTMSTTAAFGDFRMGTISAPVEPWLRSRAAAGVHPVASTRVRAKDQYRLFMSDGSGLVVNMAAKTPEIMPFDLGRVVTCICSSEGGDGREMILFGDEGGFVHQLEAGDSFDGAAIDAFVRLPFNHLGSPAQHKRYHKVTVELKAGPSTRLSVMAEFGYASPEFTPTGAQDFSFIGGGGFWDEANWDEFFWSTPVNGIAQSPIDGFGENISIVVASLSDVEEPHTLYSLALDFSPRSMIR